MSLRLRLVVGSAGLLLLSLSMSLTLANSNLYHHAVWVSFVAWLRQATLWLGLISAAGVVAVWIVDGPGRRSRSLRFRLVVGSAGLLLLSLGLSLIVANHVFEGRLFDDALWVIALEWVAEATRWLGLISAAGAVAVWVADGLTTRTMPDERPAD